MFPLGELGIRRIPVPVPFPEAGGPANVYVIDEADGGVALFDGPTAVAAAQVARLGAVTALSEAALATLLTTQSFLPNKAATFTLGSGPTTRSFVALNDGVSGFQASNDGVVEITGYSGDLRGLSVV